MRISAACFSVLIIVGIAAGSACAPTPDIADCQCVHKSLVRLLLANHHDEAAADTTGCCVVAASAAVLHVSVPRPCAHLQVSADSCCLVFKL
jgi:hypothetical protein